MFQLKFFGSLSAQRKALLGANSFAPMPLHPAVERQLALSAAAVQERPVQATRPRHLFGYALLSIRGLVCEAILWHAVSALVVLGAVFIAQRILKGHESLYVGVVLAGGYLALKLVQALVEYQGASLRRQIHRGLQLALFRCINTKLVHIDPLGRSRFSKGQLKTLVGSDVGSIEDFLSLALQQWVPVIVSSAILVPALYSVSGNVGLIALGVVLLLLPIAVAGAAGVEYFQKLAQAEQDTLTTMVGEWVKNIRLVRFLGWGESLEADINRILRRYVAWGAVRHAVVVTVYAISMSWSMLPLLAIIAVSSWEATPLNLVEVFSSFWLLDHLINQIQYIPMSLSMYGSASAGAHRVIELLRQSNIEKWILPAPATVHIAREIPERIIMRNLTVDFDGQRALDGISLDLSLSQRTAIVGSVGSGKTTLLEVLVGELPISQGEVSLIVPGHGEVPLWREDAYKRWRSLVAYSPQQPFLSNATLRCNIDLSGARSLEDVDMAVAASQLHEDLAIFPRGLDEEVGESGINLSGGQKQRVSLSRVFISKRPFLVLDDPLSAVDPRTESLLMNAILSHGKGMVLVSHRLAELERCDRVVVLEEGRVVEDGAPTVLASDPRSHFSRFLKAVEAHEH